MNNYSEELKSAVMDFVKDERNEEENQNFIPNEVALPKKNFLTECKNYKSDWVDEDVIMDAPSGSPLDTASMILDYEALIDFDYYRNKIKLRCKS